MTTSNISFASHHFFTIKTKNTMSNPTFSPQQQDTFCLNIMSNVSASFYGQSESNIQQNAQAALNALFKPTNNVISTMNDTSWQIVWGPSVFSLLIKDKKKDPDQDEYQPMNTMYIAQSQNTGQYVVAIAGTSARSVLDWTDEDFNVLTEVHWPYAAPDNLTPKITSATHFGLTHLTELKDPSTDKTALEYLKHVGAKDIMVTGHSLGGTLSPCFALFLYNKMDNSPSISCMPVAGATQGNPDFSTYYGQCLGGSTTRFWNKYDIVPHADAPALMKLVCGLYSPYASLHLLNKKDDEFRLAVEAGIVVGDLYNFTHIMPDAPSFTNNSGIVTEIQSTCSLLPSVYFYQALFQHIDAYGYFYNIGNFQAAAAAALNGAGLGLDLKYPFFNEGSLEPAPTLEAVA